LLLDNNATYYINGQSVKELWLDGMQIYAPTAAASYTRLDWIKTTSTTGGYQFDYIPEYTDHMELTVAQLYIKDNTTSSSETSVPFDAGWGYRATYATRYVTGQNSFNGSDFVYAIGTSNLGSGISVDKVRLLPYDQATTIIIDNQTGKIGNRTGTKCSGTSQPTKNLMIGGQDHNGNTTWKFKDWKVFECKIYKGDELVLHAIPVLKHEDLKPYMYDLVNDKFYETTKNVFPTYGTLE
jgi:hypothetical protein